MTALDIDALRSSLVDAAIPESAAPMAVYVRDRFVFLGVKTPARRNATKEMLKLAGSESADDLLRFAKTCWDQPEREFQYVACDLIRRHIKKLEARHLSNLHELITTKSWWDTVDALASNSVGPLVAAHPELVAAMDEWIDSDDIWVARTALLHQLSYKADTDTDRLFRYAERRSADTEFFIRKAIGWALRQYAHTNPDAIRAFVQANSDSLSGLTKREALKNLQSP